MPLDRTAPGLILSIPEVFLEERIVDVAEVNQWCYLEGSVQWLEKGLVMGSGKLGYKHFIDQVNRTQVMIHELDKFYGENDFSHLFKGRGS